MNSRNGVKVSVKTFGPWINILESPIVVSTITLCIYVCIYLCDVLVGVVLAVNARVLAKNCHPFNAALFTEIPGVQLLVWTGTGEPPISTKQINVIKNHFHRNGYSDRVGYDCQVRCTL